MAKMKEQSVALGNTQVTLSEVNGLVRVDVESVDAEVYYNGSLVAALYSDENYRRIPPAMRPFFAALDSDIRDSGDSLDIDVVLDKERISFYLGGPRAVIHARFDDLVDLGSLEATAKERLSTEDAFAVMMQVSGHLTALTNIIRGYGFDFKESHPYDGEFYAWWDVVFKPAAWDEERFRACVRAISAKKREIQDVMREHELPTA